MITLTWPAPVNFTDASANPFDDLKVVFRCIIERIGISKTSSPTVKASVAEPIPLIVGYGLCGLQWPNRDDYWSEVANGRGRFLIAF